MDKQSLQDPETIEKPKLRCQNTRNKPEKQNRIKSYTKCKPCRFALQPSSVKATTRPQSNSPNIDCYSIPTGKTITYIIVSFVPQPTIIIIIIMPVKQNTSITI